MLPIAKCRGIPWHDRRRLHSRMAPAPDSRREVAALSFLGFFGLKREKPMSFITDPSIRFVATKLNALLMFCLCLKRSFSNNPLDRAL